jgi:fructuronate reductase
MRAHIAPTLPATLGLDVPRYITDVLARFRNPAIAHQLAQIAWDGSQKLPFRLLGTISDALAAARPTAPLATPVAAWMVFAARRARSSEQLVDPLADTIAAIAQAPEAKHCARFLALETVFPPALAADPRFVETVARAHADLAAGRLAEVLAGAA